MIPFPSGLPRWAPPGPPTPPDGTPFMEPQQQSALDTPPTTAHLPPEAIHRRLPLPRGYGRVYRYYNLIMAAFVSVLLCTNLISAPYRVEIGGFVFGAGVLFFPISYLFNDILTEVYGYKRSRKVVWAGFGALAFAALVSQV